MVNKPVRLHKEQSISFMDRIGEWALNHAHILLPLAIIILLLLIGALIGVVLSGGNVTVVESGNYYNHMKDIV